MHRNGGTGGLLLAEITCGGGALFDYDGDGDLDAFLLQGGRLDPAAADATSSDADADRLYRNDLEAGGGLRFTDVTPVVGVAKTAYGCAAATGDYDNDGRVDLYLANLGPDQLLHNEGGGRFRDVTAESGTSDDRASTTALFFDFDRDGLLDLYVGNYVSWDYTGATACRSLSGAPDYCGPGAFPYQPDRLFRNRGDGTFEDVTSRSGLALARPSPTLGAVAGDFDGDGWPDLFVANDGEPNFLFRNRRDGTFVEVAQLAGCAVNAEGRSEASMGVDAGDFDADGDLDLFVTHLIKETNTLFRNDGAGGFEDYTRASGLGPPSLPFTSFGTRFLDFDNDGWLDLLVVSGAVTMLPDQVAAGDPFPLHQTKQLFRNLGAEAGARFADATAQAGASFARSEVSRGAAFGDVDNDGDTDALVINNNGPARLLLNRIGNERPWIGARLVGGRPARDRLGALVMVLRQGRAELVRRAASDGSYASASDPRVLFGLGENTEYEGFRVVWPEGMVEDFPPAPNGTYVTLRQGEGGAPG